MYGSNEDIPETSGELDPNLGTITLIEGISHDRAVFTVFHELVHHMLGPAPEDSIPSGIEELVCDLVAYGFLELIRDNPDLVTLMNRYFLEENKQCSCTTPMESLPVQVPAV